MLKTIRHLLELIRFSHTLFALPFALLAAVMAWRLQFIDQYKDLQTPHIDDQQFNELIVAMVKDLGRFLDWPVIGKGQGFAIRWQEIVGILLCMIAARSFAMAFNRLADRKIDAGNPRTATRHLPAGILSVRQVTIFATVCAAAFVASTLLFLPNRLPLFLSIPLLAFLAGYSFTKRFTALAHFWLGASLALSPVAAWIAIRGQQVTSHPADLLPALVLGGAVLWMLIALPVGILSALRPRSLLDRGAMIFILIGISAPVVWIGLLLQYFVGFKWGLTPNARYCDVIDPPAGASCGGPGDWAYHMILPWLTFAILFAASYARMIRANVMDTLGEDYVRTARAKGAPENVVIRRHVLRNALLPVVTMLGLDIGVALGGAIFTEAIFNLPGLGRLALNSVLNLDLPTMQGVIVFATLTIILLNLVVDLVYAMIDPRIRLA